MSFARVTTNTNNSKYSKRQFTTTRRFSDFLGLHDILVSKYLRCGRIIPPAPQKNIIGECGKLVANQSHKTAISIMNLYGGLSVYFRKRWIMGHAWRYHTFLWLFGLFSITDKSGSISFERSNWNNGQLKVYNRNLNFYWLQSRKKMDNVEITTSWRQGFGTWMGDSSVLKRNVL